jgi:hypothetical protein
MKPLLEAAFLTLCLSPLLALAISFSSTDAQQDLTTELSKDWGKNPTSNVHLDLREMDRKKAGGSTRVTYHMETSGFPGEKAYTVWMRQSVDQKIVRFISGYSADASGKLVCPPEPQAGTSSSDDMPIPCTKLSMPLEQFPFSIGHYHKGEPLSLAVVSTDGAVKAFVTAYPFPIQVRDGNCSLTVELKDHQGHSFMIHGEGFDQGEEIKFAATSGKEEIHGTQQASPQGEISHLLLPGVKGKHSGPVSFTATSTSCSPNVTFEWGSAAMKIQ